MKSSSTLARTSAVLAVVGLTLTAAACTTAADPTPTSTARPAATAPPATSASAPASTDAAGSGDSYRLDLAPDGNEARFRVREQLARLSFPSDAVGATQAITGSLVINLDGTLVSEQSKFVVDLTTLQSDSGMRDNFIRRNTLQTQQFPTAEFVPTSVTGLPIPLPTSGAVQFQLIGDLTVHGVTRPVTWEVTGQALDGRELTGTAATEFTFEDFGMSPPRAGAVLSVTDLIRLELDFHLIGSPLQP